MGYARHILARWVDFLQQTDGGTNPTVFWLLSVSVRPGATCDEAKGGYDECFFFLLFFMNREKGWGNSCVPDQLALTAIVKFFSSSVVFIWAIKTS